MFASKYPGGRAPLGPYFPSDLFGPHIPHHTGIDPTPRSAKSEICALSAGQERAKEWMNPRRHRMRLSLPAATHGLSLW